MQACLPNPQNENDLTHVLPATPSEELAIMEWEAIRVQPSKRHVSQEALSRSTKEIN